MLGHFPPGYPDEAFVNICARYQEHVGDKSSVPVAKRLFGAQGPVHLYWPIRLENLVNQLPSEFAISVDQLIEEHTLAPFLLPFLTGPAMTELREYMRGSDSSRRLGMVGVAQEEWLVFKYCPLCAKEDRDEYGEAYWRRVHQPSIVDVCPDHACHLKTYENYNAIQGTLVPAEREIPLESSVRFIEPTNPKDALKLWLARQVKWLLENPRAVVSSANLSTAFTRRFTELHLLTTRGLPDFVQIRTTFRSYLKSQVDCDDEWLERYKVTSDRSLQMAIRSQCGSPGLLLLFMNWLGIEAKSLPKVSANVHFESGPWPCLNKVCDFYGINVVEDYALGHSHTGVKRGVFSCQCGYSYSRPAPDRDGSTRTKPSKILKTGKAWERRFIELWGDWAVTKPEIAAELGCSMTFVRKMSVALDLPLRKNRPKTRTERNSTALKFEKKREAYRHDVCELKRQFPKVERGDFYARLPRQIQWLLKNDRDWLMRVLPACKQGGPKVDWMRRDLELSKKVRGVRQQFIDDDVKDGRLRPLSRNRFFSELRIHHNAVRRGRYPRTIAAVTEATESSAKFKIRRLFYLLQGDAAELPNTFLQLLTIVEIRLEMRETDSLKDVLSSAEKLFLTRVRSRLNTKAA